MIDTRQKNRWIQEDDVYIAVTALTGNAQLLHNAANSLAKSRMLYIKANSFVGGCTTLYTGFNNLISLTDFCVSATGASANIATYSGGNCCDGGVTGEIWGFVNAGTCNIHLVTFIRI